VKDLAVARGSESLGHDWKSGCSELIKKGKAITSFAFKTVTEEVLS